MKPSAASKVKTMLQKLDESFYLYYIDNFIDITANEYGKDKIFR